MTLTLTNYQRTCLHAVLSTAAKAEVHFVPGNIHFATTVNGITRAVCIPSDHDIGFLSLLVEANPLCHALSSPNASVSYHDGALTISSGITSHHEVRLVTGSPPDSLDGMGGYHFSVPWKTLHDALTFTQSALPQKGDTSGILLSPRNDYDEVVLVGTDRRRMHVEHLLRVSASLQEKAEDYRLPPEVVSAILALPAPEHDTPAHLCFHHKEFSLRLGGIILLGEAYEDSDYPDWKLYAYNPYDHGAPSFTIRHPRKLCQQLKRLIKCSNPIHLRLSLDSSTSTVSVFGMSGSIVKGSFAFTCVYSQGDSEVSFNPSYLLSAIGGMTCQVDDNLMTLCIHPPPFRACVLSTPNRQAVLMPLKL